LTITEHDTDATTTDTGKDGVLALPAQAQALLFRQAHTANTFTDEPVTEEQVRAVYDLVKYAPTSMNTQPLRVTLIRTSQARERLLAHLAPGNRDKTAQAPLVAVLSADREFHEHLPVLVPHFPGAKDRFADPALREAVAMSSGWLQVGYFILGIRAAGLAAGPMTGFDGPALEAELFPGGTRKVLAVVNIGRPGPDAFRPRAPRLDYEQVVTSI
jgi:3-hydroxypropanoate dehydrogenase